MAVQGFDFFLGFWALVPWGDPAVPELSPGTSQSLRASLWAFSLSSGIWFLNSFSQASKQQCLQNEMADLFIIEVNRN